MEILHCDSNFPKRSKTFIANQVTGLLDRGHDVSVLSHFPPEDGLDQYRGHNLDELVTYSVDSRRTADIAQGLLGGTIRNPDLASEVAGALGQNAGLKLLDRVSARSHPRTGIMTLLNQMSVRNRHPAPDVVHVHFGNHAEKWVSIPEFADVPTVVSFYGVDASGHLFRDPDRYTAVFDAADAVTGLSDHMLGLLYEAGCPQGKLSKQPLGVDMEDHSPGPPKSTSDGPLSLLTVCRLTPKKGIRYVIEAIADLPDDLDVRYRIGGSGEQEAELRRLANACGVADSVAFLGWLTPNEVAAEMRNCHAFVQPSVIGPDGDMEGTPTVLLEAQAAGKPVISTYHAGIPEIVVDRASTLVPERDSAALSSAIQRFADNKDEWDAMGEAARANVADTHSIDAVAARLERLYGEVA